MRPHVVAGLGEVTALALNGDVLAAASQGKIGFTTLSAPLATSINMLGGAVDVKAIVPVPGTPLFVVQSTKGKYLLVEPQTGVVDRWSGTAYVLSPPAAVYRASVVTVCYQSCAEAVGFVEYAVTLSDQPKPPAVERRSLFGGPRTNSAPVAVTLSSRTGVSCSLFDQDSTPDTLMDIQAFEDAFVVLGESVIFLIRRHAAGWHVARSKRVEVTVTRGVTVFAHLVVEASQIRVLMSDGHLYSFDAELAEVEPPRGLIRKYDAVDLSVASLPDKIASVGGGRLLLGFPNIGVVCLSNYSVERLLPAGRLWTARAGLLVLSRAHNALLLVDF